MVAWRSESRDSRGSRKAANSLRSMRPNSPMSLPSSLNCKLMALSRAPWQVGQVTLCMNDCAQRRSGMDLAFSAERTIAATRPSNGTVPPRTPPLSWSLTSRSVPYKIWPITSSGMSPTEVEGATPFSAKIASTMRDVRLSFSLPSGAMPPRFTVTLGSGMSVSGSTCATWPRPLHVGQAPYGLLKLNRLGSGSG